MSERGHVKGDGLAPRELVAPDELTSMHPSVQLIILASARPVMAFRPAYFLDVRYRDERSSPLYDTHPNYADLPLAPPIDFLAPGLDLGAALSPWLDVG